jgi:hypothetical protein
MTGLQSLRDTIRASAWHLLDLYFGDFGVRREVVTEIVDVHHGAGCGRRLTGAGGRCTL